LLHKEAAQASAKTTCAAKTTMLENTTCLVPLTQSQFAIVSPEDFEWAMQFKWQAQKSEKTNGVLWYARRRSVGPNRMSFLMHREIARRAGLPDSPDYDHKDRNSLNNTRENLRPCTRSQSNANRCKFSGKTTSKLKGAYWHKVMGKWASGIKMNGKRIPLGYFDTDVEAHEAYMAASRKYHGEFACAG
jgi:hypothetical protein